MRPTFQDKYYCDIRHVPRLASSRNYTELAVVVLEVIQVMHELHPGEVFHQICGAISTGPGTVDEKLLRFERAINYQRNLGRIVFNQLPAETMLGVFYEQRRREKKFKKYDYALLHEFYLPIFKSGLIHKLVFLPNWHLSIGARWEHDQAILNGIKIEYLLDNWEESALNGNGSH